MPVRKSKRQRGKLSVDTELGARSGIAPAAVGVGTASPESTDLKKNSRAGPSGQAKNKTRANKATAPKTSSTPASGLVGTHSSSGRDTPITPDCARSTTPTSLPAAKEAGGAVVKGKTAAATVKKNNPKTLKRSLPLPTGPPPGRLAQLAAIGARSCKRTHIEGRWTKDEDAKLRAAVVEMTHKIGKISQTPLRFAQ